MNTESDDYYVICPYCQHKHVPDSADAREAQRDEDCEECGKTYMIKDVFFVEHVTWTKEAKP